MIPVQELIQVFHQMIGWPYATPGVNGPGGIDCSGAFVYAYRQFGQSIYHGSNRIARVFCHDLRPVTDAKALRPGMVIFKSRQNTDGMKAEYKPGGRYYNPEFPQDFYHMGLVAGVSPLQIINATRPRVLISKALKGWTYAGLLNAVSYDEGAPAPAASQAVVSAESGGSVNLRSRPQAGAAIVVRVPLGQLVDVLDKTNDDWWHVRYQSSEGYMMSRFLKQIC